MTALERLLAQIRLADRTSRIEYRDKLAAHGADAIPPLRAWLDDAEFGAFAVRALHQIAQYPAQRRGRRSAGRRRGG